MLQENRSRTILVPTDLSEVAENALDHAIKIAKLFQNDILLLHIIEDSFLGSLLGIKTSVKDGLVMNLLQDKLDQKAKEIEEKHGIPTKAVIKEGRIYKTILEVSEEIRCDSIMMGTNGASGIGQLVGSNASRVIAHSEVPVIVIKDKPIGEGYKNIILPIDLTLESKQKVAWAIHVAKKFNSVVHIISVKENDEFLLNKTKANLSQVEEVLDKNGVSYTAKMLDLDDYSGNIAEDTLEYAEEVNADLIIIMTQQEKEGISEFVVGTYAQQIVNKQSTIPVLCISPRQIGFKSEYWSGF